MLRGEQQQKRRPQQQPSASAPLASNGPSRAELEKAKQAAARKAAKEAEKKRRKVNSARYRAREKQRAGGMEVALKDFLVKTNAATLDAILHKQPIPGVEFHCFTSKALDNPESQLRSHQKQRKLFQDLFSKCTGVIVSAGNETVWEAVCRGVPVLTIPTDGHGEQLLNAAVHARNFPSLVRTRPRLEVDDLEWLVNFDSNTPTAKQESSALRAKVDELQKFGSPLLGGTRTSWISGRLW